MTCPCCSKNINDLDNTFGRERARRDAQRYLARGLDVRAKKLIAYAAERLNASATVLEIGCGAGAVHHELLRNGTVAAATGVDASSAYLAAAGNNAETLGLQAQTVYVHADFAQSAENIAPANLVVLDRVICCYPYLEALLGKAAQHTTQFLAISFPVDRWWVHVGHRLADFVLKLMNSGYHPYVHAMDDILAVTQSAGLRLVELQRRHLWQIAVFERTLA